MYISEKNHPQAKGWKGRTFSLKELFYRAKTRAKHVMDRSC
jgi:hypothetical protein